jgi:Fur family peroxide stress response transcriptional regulator
MTHLSATEHIVTHLREAGLRVTPQRIAVYSELVRAHDHPTAADLFVRLRLDMPSLSQATIYNTLQVMAGMGLVRELSTTGEGPARYDADLHPHAHLVCTRCGRIDDFDSPALAMPAPGDFPSGSGYDVESMSVFFYGRCPACRAGARGDGGEDG